MTSPAKVGPKYGKIKQAGLTRKARAAIDFFYGAAKFNKTTACRMAGYAHPRQSATSVWGTDAAKAYIAEKELELQTRYRLDRDALLSEIAKIAYSSMKDFLVIDEKTGAFYVGVDKIAQADLDSLAALAEVSVETYMEGHGEDAQAVKRVKIKPYNKLSALDMLIRHQGLSQDKAAQTVEVNLIDRIREGRRRVGRSEENEDETNG